MLRVITKWQTINGHWHALVDHSSTGWRLHCELESAPGCNATIPPADERFLAIARAKLPGADRDGLLAQLSEELVLGAVSAIGEVLDGRRPGAMAQQALSELLERVNRWLAGRDGPGAENARTPE